MANNNNTDEFFDISSKNHQKLSESLNKEGYAEGITDGKDSIFQKSFDKGFADGLKSGFELGKHQGEQKLKTDDIHILLNNPQRAQCQICQDPTLINKTIEELEVIYKNHHEQISTALHERFKNEKL